MRTSSWNRIAGHALVAALLVFAVVPAHAITITILNNDAAGEGFNDPTAAAPVGGNPGLTVGQQRLNVFTQAANIWSSLLPGPGVIQIRAQFNPLSCDATSAVLGSAGPVWVESDFPGAPFPGHWFNGAEVNNLIGADGDPANPEINATFNSNLGLAGCLTGRFFYYGFDGAEGANIDLLAVLLHEFGHGLGFLTVTNAQTGVQCCGAPLLPAAWDKFLLDNSTGLHWDAMTNAQRAASAINTGHLVWDGPAVTNFASTFQSGQPKMHVNSPGGIVGDYLVGSPTFGPSLTPMGISGNVVLVNDGVGTTTDGCETPFTNAGAIAGNIALIDRGTCAFTVKVKNAQNAGAIAVIVGDNVAGTPPPGMTGEDPTITIPSVRITLADANLIKANLGAGVNVTLITNPGQLAGADNLGRMKLYTPNPFQSGSSVSHYDVSALPNLLMEPAINPDLNSSSDAKQKVDLTYQLFEDIGWFPSGTGVDIGRTGRPSLSNAPNPFGRSSTTIRFELGREGDIDLSIYDLNGRLVKQLIHGSMPQGKHAVAWNGRGADGQVMPSGVYLYRLKGAGAEQTQHMVLYR